MESDSRWHTMVYHLQAAFAALLVAGTAQGCANAAAPGSAWQTGGLDALIHSFLAPASALR